MNGRERVKVWDLPLRVFHWVLVLAIAMAFLSSEEDSLLNDWHVLSGWVAAILIVFRLVWGFMGGEHSRFSDFVRPGRIGPHISAMARGERKSTLGHNPLGGIAVLALLGLIASTVWTGAFGGEPAEELHEVIAWVLLAMVALHVVAVIFMSILERENLVRAMVTGDKPAARHPDARDARSPSPVALLAGGAVVVGATYLIVQYDPDAFALRSPESYEHRTGAAGPDMGSERGETDQD